MDIHARVKLLEDKFDVAMGEINGVLKEIQVMNEGQVKTVFAALRTFHERIAALEGATKEAPRVDEVGKEL